MAAGSFLTQGLRVPACAGAQFHHAVASLNRNGIEQFLPAVQQVRSKLIVTVRLVLVVRIQAFFVGCASDTGKGC